MKTIIYGASDDLIEIAGEYSEEFGAYNNEDMRVGLSDGTLLSVEYDGEWKFRCEEKGRNFVEIIPSVGDDKNHAEPYERYTSYSDLVVFEGIIEWVTLSKKGDSKKF